MGKKQDEEALWFRRHFPTVAARYAADEAIDRLPCTEPMTVFLDLWIAAYVLAGGITKIGV